MIILTAEEARKTLDVMEAARARDAASAVFCRLYLIRAPLFERFSGKHPSFEVASAMLELSGEFAAAAA